MPVQLLRVLGGQTSDRQPPKAVLHIADLVPIGLRRCWFEIRPDVLVPEIKNVAEGEVAGLELVVGVGQFDDEARQRDLCFAFGSVERASFVPTPARGLIAAPIDDQAPVARAPPFEMTLALDRRPVPATYREGAGDRIVLAPWFMQFEVLRPTAGSIPADLRYPGTGRNLAGRQHPRHPVRTVAPSPPPHGPVSLGVA